MIFSWIKEELESIRNAHNYRKLRPLETPCGPRVRAKGRDLRCFSSNDYLGLASDPRVAEAAARAARNWGAGAGASRLITGTLGLHAQLEEELARLKGTGSALIFSTGYQANLGLLTVLGAEGVIFSDQLNHASIADGCRLARARVEVYRHRDVGHLARLLAHHDATPRKVVVTDGVFSMDGDLAPLPDLLEVSRRNGALVVVDEAHATGVVGDGRGTVHHFGLDPEEFVLMGTLGKALGAFGAFVAAHGAVRELLVNCARSMIFTTALPPPVLGAALEGLRILRAEPGLVERLAENARRLRMGLAETGFGVSDDPTPIVPVILGGNERVLRWSEWLWEQGFWVHPIRPPTVAPGTSRLRISVSSKHTREDIDALVEALGKLARLEGFGEARP